MEKDQTAKRAESLGTERIFKLILQYALPAIAMMLISSLYNIVDKIFVGNFVGQIGITATTVAHPIVRFVDAFAILVGSGGSTLLALRLGEGKSEEAEDILNNSFLLMILFCAALILVGYLFPERLLRLFGAREEVMPYALTYLRIVLAGATFNSIANSFGLFVRVDGSGKYHHVNSRDNVLRPLPDLNLRSFSGQPVGEGRRMHIGTGYGKSLVQKDLRESAHADSADPDKMHMLRFLKIYLIHAVT